MSAPKFVIASTGRSGSGYISKVLRAAEINCGHEEYFCFPWRTPKEGLDGDSSWLAVGHLDEYEGRIFHQVRNPLHVLTSLCYTYPEKVKDKYIPHRYAMIPGGRTADLQKDFMRMIVSMNREIEKHATIWWQIEHAGPEDIKMICMFAGLEWDKEKAAKAFESVSIKYNQHHNRQYMRWDQIPDSEEKTALKDQAEQYGYN